VRLADAAPSWGTRQTAVILAEAGARGRRAAQAFGLAATHLLDTLKSAGIRALPLKGPRLSKAIYGDGGIRACHDVDVLVSAEDLPAAVVVMRRLGFEMPEDPVDRRGGPALHFAMRHATGALPRVELHWRVHWQATDFSAAMLAASTEVGGDLRARPVDELASLLLFYARDGFVGLRLAADLAAWWDHRGGELPPAGMRELAGRYPGLRRLWTTAALAAEQVVGLPAERLIDVPADDRRARAALRLVNWGLRGDVEQIRATSSLVDILLAEGAQTAATARRALWPSLDDLLEMFGPQGASGFMIARAGHLTRQLTRYGIALWGLRDKSRVLTARPLRSTGGPRRLDLRAPARP
jgi:hypothetical protein